MNCTRNAQHLPSSVQPLIPPVTDLDAQMRPVWEIDTRQEHLAIACRAHELFERRGCEDGRDWEDWFRAELELHLNE